MKANCAASGLVEHQFPPRAGTEARNSLPLVAPAVCPGTGWLASAVLEPPLLHCLAQGDPGAFWPLWLAHRDYLFQLCCHYLEGRRADAEDALERVWPKALAGLPRVALQMTNLKAWLGRVAVNVCRDIHREEHCRRWELTDVEDAPVEADESFAAPDLDPAETLLLHELEDFLAGAVHDLPPGLRPAAELFFLEDCSADEVGKPGAFSLQRPSAAARGRVDLWSSRGEGERPWQSKG
jgi:DNA-directed RNA polymerase specialized sigma24 family protein